MRTPLSLAVALAAAAVIAFEVARTSGIPLAILVGLFVFAMIYNTISGVITGLREMRTTRFWIVLVALVLGSLATLGLR